MSKKKKKQRWPTRDAMAQIYAKQLWGGEEGAFYSGEGSHRPEFVEPYVEAVSEFLTSFDEPLVVCDLGCGDFNIGRRLLPLTKHYHAIDIVPELINRNQQIFQSDHLDFHCLDISKDKLPEGDCAILRQVMQHLSNDEVKRIVVHLSKFRYVILTEHIPLVEFIPNKDIISGQGIRIKQNSGIDLQAAPFHFMPKSMEELTSIELKNGKGRVVTWLMEKV